MGQDIFANLLQTTKYSRFYYIDIKLYTDKVQVPTLRIIYIIWKFEVCLKNLLYDSFQEDKLPIGLGFCPR
jgi:hypothetical protein